jgi:DNA polymerase-3 subunit delta
VTVAAPPRTAPVHIVRGEDLVLVDRAVAELVTDLVGEGDRSLVVDELTSVAYDPAGSGTPEIGSVVDAAQTPPFLTERRVVVARQAMAFGGGGAKESKARLAPLIDYLSDPLPTTSLVVVWEKVKPSDQKKQVPKPLLDAVKAAGGVVVDADAPGRANDRSAWVDDQIEAAGLRLDVKARRAVTEHLGEGVNRLPGLLETLKGAYGPRARLSVDDIAPFLGEAGGVAPWDLTDAIDRGDVNLALSVLTRMLDGGGRAPMQIIWSLNKHVMQMVRLDGEVVADEAAAAEILGLKIDKKGGSYPAKKVLTQSRRLGTERLVDMVDLLARADLDLRGARNLDDRVVMEVLVARLARRSRR